MTIDLHTTLNLHLKWLKNEEGGVRADLRAADLRSADLRSANLRFADLCAADLRSADLRFADLSFANLSSANLSSADLRSADLRSAGLPKGLLVLYSHTYSCYFFNGELRIGCQAMKLKKLTKKKAKELVNSHKISTYDQEMFKQFIRMCRAVEKL